MPHLLSLYVFTLCLTSLKRAIPSSDIKKFCGKKQRRPLLWLFGCNKEFKVLVIERHKTTSLSALRDVASERDVQFLSTLCWITAYLQLLLNESQNIKRKRVFLGYKFMTRYYSSLSAMSFRYKSILLPPTPSPPHEISTLRFSIGRVMQGLNISVHQPIHFFFVKDQVICLIDCTDEK